MIWLLFLFLRNIMSCTNIKYDKTTYENLNQEEQNRLDLMLTMIINKYIDDQLGKEMTLEDK